MRFFSCYGTPRMDPPPQEHSKSDMRRLVSPRRRGRTLAPPDWKPALHSIAEDTVVAPVRPKPPDQINRAKRTSRRCAPSRDNYSREPIHMMVVPTFAPTPFMF